MANPTYGVVFNELKAKGGSAITLVPNLNGTPATTIWASPEVRDISIKPGGDYKEFKGIDGEYEAVSASGFYYDITFTLLPAGADRETALKACTILDIGTPFTVANAPEIPVHGHTAQASPRVPAGSGLGVLNGVMYLQSMDISMSVEKETTGTITLRRYPALSDITPL
jgi:hypothetical protein